MNASDSKVPLLPCSRAMAAQWNHLGASESNDVWDPDLTGVGCRQNTGIFTRSRGDANVQPSLRPTECGRLIYARHYTDSYLCMCIISFRPCNQ